MKKIAIILGSMALCAAWIPAEADALVWHKKVSRKLRKVAPNTYKKAEALYHHANKATNGLLEKYVQEAYEEGKKRAAQASKEITHEILERAKEEVSKHHGKYDDEDEFLHTLRKGLADAALKGIDDKADSIDDHFDRWFDNNAASLG